MPADAISRESNGLPEEYFDDFDEYDGGERYCYDCGGRGWKITCPDDLCHGQDECIHGDDPIPCRTCNPKGDLDDRLCN